MQLPRFRLRTLMLAVAIVAIVLRLAPLRAEMNRRSDFYRQRAAYHAALAAAHRIAGKTQELRADRSKEDADAARHREGAAASAKVAAYHAGMRDKYNRVARYPWLPVEPDPQSPEIEIGGCAHALMMARPSPPPE